MLPNTTQSITTTSALVGVLAGYAAGHGWLGLDVGAWTVVIGGIAAGAAVVVPAIVTRAQALKNATGHLDHTTVVTDKASADALPNNPDVVAATPAIVAAIKQAQP
jgi:hypothetical protein